MWSEYLGSVILSYTRDLDFYDRKFGKMIARNDLDPVGKFFIFIIKSLWSVIIWCLASKVAWWALIISMLSLLPAISGSELGFRRWYIRFLVDLFDWATNRLDARVRSFLYSV